MSTPGTTDHIGTMNSQSAQNPAEKSETPNLVTPPIINGKTIIYLHAFCTVQLLKFTFLSSRPTTVPDDSDHSFHIGVPYGHPNFSR